MKKVWVNSLQADRPAILFERVSCVVTVGASMTLALTARDPNMLHIYPLFFVGSSTQCYAAYRRGAAWVTLLTGYFAIINVFGYMVAKGVI
jgi:hypothetical protein